MKAFQIVSSGFQECSCWAMNEIIDESNFVARQDEFNFMLRSSIKSQNNPWEVILGARSRLEIRHIIVPVIEYFVPLDVSRSHHHPRPRWAQCHTLLDPFCNYTRRLSAYIDSWAGCPESKNDRDEAEGRLWSLPPPFSNSCNATRQLSRIPKELYITTGP